MVVWKVQVTRAATWRPKSEGELDLDSKKNEICLEPEQNIMSVNDDQDWGDGFSRLKACLIRGSMCFAVVCSKRCCFKLLDHGSLNLFHHGEILWGGFSIMDDGLFNIGVTGLCWYLLHSLKFTAGLPCLVPNEPQFTPQIIKFGCFAISFWVILGRSLFAPSQMTSVFLA